MDNNNLRIDNVPARFKEIPSKVRSSPYFGSTKRYLGARTNGMIPWPDFTSTDDNELGLGEHFQGIQRIGQHLIVSGGIKSGTRRSQLVVILMKSKSKSGPWALPKYGFSYKKPSPDDKIVKVVDIDRQNWHAGGIQAVGDVLAVPVYGHGSSSEIRYFDFRDPENGPTEIEEIKLIKTDIKSKAVALARLPNDHYMTMIWDDENFDFHYCNSPDILSGFAKDRNARINKTEVKGEFQPGGGGISGGGTYQSINFVLDTDDTVYFVATRNQEKASPTFHGKDFADLFKVLWPNGFEAEPEIHYVDHKQIYCYNQQCNFGAGAGIYIDDPKHFFLYGASHWLHGGNARYNFNEYSYT
jgi:hypothetical protein